MIKKKVKTLHAFEPLHCQNFYFCPGFTEDQFKNSVISTYGKEVDIDSISLSGNGKCLAVKVPVGYGIFIWIRDPKDLKSFIHEVVHASAFALCDRGYNFDINQEVFSYLCGYLTEQFWSKK